MLTPEDLQQYLKISRRTFFTWRAAGRLPAPDLAIGKTLRWRQRTIEAWLTSKQADGGEA